MSSSLTSPLTNTELLSVEAVIKYIIVSSPRSLTAVLSSVQELAQDITWETPTKSAGLVLMHELIAPQ